MQKLANPESFTFMGPFEIAEFLLVFRDPHREALRAGRPKSALGAGMTDERLPFWTKTKMKWKAFAWILLPGRFTALRPRR